MVKDFSSTRLFRVLVAFRWVSLAPAFLLLINKTDGEGVVGSLPVLSAVIFVNLFVTFNVQWLNDLLRRQPWVIILDILFSTGVFVLSGAGQGPYYLYSLSPLLAAAFFFHLNGGLIAAGLHTFLYIVLVTTLGGMATAFANPALWITQMAGIWLIPAVIGELSKISQDLQIANRETSFAKAELTRQNVELFDAHERLQTIHDLTRLLQAAPDVRSMQEQVLTTLAQSLKYDRALLGLVKPGTMLLHSWKGLEAGVFVAETGVSAKPALNIDSQEHPLIGQVLATSEPRLLDHMELPGLHPVLEEWVGDSRLLAIPLVFHEQTVGVLMIPVADEGFRLVGDQDMLIRTLANQAATSLGTTMLCVERAQDLAVEQERNRIAREIHDTVSQSLFGMIYSLDACIRMLPEQAAAVKEELIELQTLANLTRDQVRHSIFDLWPSSLTLDIFKSDLNHYVSHCFRLVPFNIEYEVEGGFNELSPAIRRNLYRITQEALTNVLHHAAVERAKVRIEINPEVMELSVEDNGIGFDVQSALSREYNREHFGLHGIRERAQALGGECRIISAPGAGSKIRVTIPVKSGKGVQNGQ